MLTGGQLPGLEHFLGRRPTQSLSSDRLLSLPNTLQGEVPLRPISQTVKRCFSKKGSHPAADPGALWVITWAEEKEPMFAG